MEQVETSQGRQKFLEGALSAVQAEIKKRQEERLKYCWKSQARDAQKIPEGDWRIWLILAGRGFGKTRTGAETVREWVHQSTYQRIALIGRTQRETQSIMVEGVSGLLTVSPRAEQLKFEPSKRQLKWPNGAVATLFSGDNYEVLRGPQFDAAWIDELAKFRYSQEAYDQLMLSLRLGRHPRLIITTTPRPIPLLETLLERDDVVVTRGSTFENEKNLSPSYLAMIKERYQNTRLGAQEVYGEILVSRMGALWSRDLIQYLPFEESKQWGDPLFLNRFSRMVLGVDPAVSETEGSHETGVILAGKEENGKIVILGDFSLKAPVMEWAKQVVALYHRYKVDRVVAEVNQGGDLIEKVLKVVDANLSYASVRACRGKQLRAEPVVAHYEQKRVRHLHPFLELEQQMCSYIPGKGGESYDRLDALVWAVTSLMEEPKKTPHKIWAAC